MADATDEPVPEAPATWENVVVGKVKKLLGRAVGDEELTEEGDEQAGLAHDVREEYHDEHREPGAS